MEARTIRWLLSGAASSEQADEDSREGQGKGECAVVMVVVGDGATEAVLGRSDVLARESRP
jgi:hypothetical protein